VNVFNNAILARNRQLPDDDRLIETCRSIFKSYNVNSLIVCIGWCGDQVTLRSARCNNKDGLSVYSSNSVIAPFDVPCPFHWSQYAVSPHVSIKTSHSTVQSALRLHCTHFCQIFIIISPSLMTKAHAFLSNNLLPLKVPTLQYSGLVLERQTLRHYGEGIRYSNSESGDPIQ